MRKTIERLLLRHLFNLMPFYRRTGGRVVYISKEEDEVHIKLPYCWSTRGWTGALYGGHIYGAVDGVYITMLHRLLGRNYIIWDKSAVVSYLRPARDTITAKIRIPDGELDLIRNALRESDSLERDYTIEWRDAAGGIVSVIEKKLHFRKRKESAAKTAGHARRPMPE